jgi:stage III sporulation protein AF
LAQLIVIVVISIVAEMLLPTRATEKYVRAVLGVAMIAAMINPIVPLLKGQSAKALASTAASLFQGAPAAPATPSSASLETSYQQTLDHEEETSADRLVAASLRSTLPAALRNDISSIEIENAMTPSDMLIRVRLDGGGKTTEDDVTDAICDLLAIRPAQVVVTVDGGT